MSGSTWRHPRSPWFGDRFRAAPPLRPLTGAPRVEVLPATLAERRVVANLLELYAHDFSEFLDLRPGPSGRFGYPRLGRFWTEPGRHPFLLRVDGELAGTVLVARGSRLRDAPEVWDVAEFFVLRRHRKRGVGRAAAEAVWRRFPGEWEVRVVEGNEPALAFWAAAVAGFTGEPAMPTAAEAGGKRWRVFRFRSPGDVDGRGASDGEG